MVTASAISHGRCRWARQNVWGPVGTFPALRGFIYLAGAEDRVFWSSASRLQRQCPPSQSLFSSSSSSRRLALHWLAPSEAASALRMSSLSFPGFQFNLTFQLSPARVVYPLDVYVQLSSPRVSQRDAD